MLVEMAVSYSEEGTIEDESGVSDNGRKLGSFQPPVPH